MKLKSTLSRWLTILFLGACLSCASTISAQVYCTPTFVNGCFSWSNQSVTLGSLSWSLGISPCTDYDYTWMTANLTTGIPHLMTVNNEDWCGCAVWIDFNQDSAFDASENMFYDYQANEVNTYTIWLTIPNGTPVGSYRMRVIAPWGSDGFLSTNINGYGPCGAFQYGNFDDFTVNVTGPQGLQEPIGNPSGFISANLNRQTNVVSVTVKDYQSGTGMLQLTDVTGKNIQTIQIRNETEYLDLNAFSKGLYFLNYSDGSSRQSVKFIKN